MSNPDPNDVLTCLFVRILHLLEIKSEQETVNFISNSEWMHVYPDTVKPINPKDYVLLFNYETYIWVEVVLTEQYLELNKTREEGNKLFIGKIQNIIENKPYTYGTHVYFTKSQIVSQKTFSELLEYYSK